MPRMISSAVERMMAELTPEQQEQINLLIDALMALPMVKDAKVHECFSERLRLQQGVTHTLFVVRDDNRTAGVHLNMKQWTELSPEAQVQNRKDLVMQVSQAETV